MTCNRRGLACALPVLRKDFLFCDYQLYESAAMGADAVLLIVRILTEPRLADLLRSPPSLGLAALVEVYSEPTRPKPPPAPALAWSASTTAT